MAITINYGTKIITVPQADLTPLGGSLYELNANDFRNVLKNLEDDESGIAFLPTLRHATQSTLSGVTYARQVEIINGYTISFQNTGTPYTVKVAGANHNIGDVTNFDGGMSLIIGNAAGLVVSGSGVTEQDKLDIADRTWDEIASEHLVAGSLGKFMNDIRQIGSGRWKIVSNQMILYDTDGVTALFTFDLKDASGNPTETNPKERVPA